MSLVQQIPIHMLLLSIAMSYSSGIIGSLFFLGGICTYLLPQMLFFLPLLVLLNQ